MMDHHLSNKLCALFLFLFAAIAYVSANSVEENVETTPPKPELAVLASADFSSTEIFGIKVLNGHKTSAVINLVNSEVKPIKVALVRGALSSLQKLSDGVHPSATIVSNLTSVRYDMIIPAGGNQSIPYTFTTNLHPQDLQMSIYASIINDEGVKFQVQAFNGTVTVLDPATNIFDPQILFLYLILLCSMGGIFIWLYKVWIKPHLPQVKRGNKLGVPTRRASPQLRSPQNPEEISFTKATEGTENISGSQGDKTYDESWIPDHHINKPVARRVKNGSIKKKNFD